MAMDLPLVEPQVKRALCSGNGVSSVDSNAGPYTSKRLWVIYRNTPRFIKEFDLRHRSGAQGGFIFKVT
jgi:hypothetical protein